MKANVYDEGRAPAVPQRNAVGKPTSPKTKARAKAGGGQGGSSPHCSC